MKITVKLFSSLMEYLPPDVQENELEIVQTNPITPVQILTRFKIPENEVHTMMINGVFLPPENRNDVMKDGDCLTVWPALQGG